MKIAIVGPGASGKDYLLNLHKDYLKVGIKYTTRPMRPGEIENITYYYINNQQFLEKLNNNEIVIYQHFKDLDWYYGFDSDEIKYKNCFILTPDEIKQLKDRENWYIIYLNVPEEIRIKRLTERSDFNDALKDRLNRDRKDFKNFDDFDLEIIEPNHINLLDFNLFF